MSEGSGFGSDEEQDEHIHGSDFYLSQNHSFILRIRREGQAEDAWRGSIEHVGSGQRFFFQDLNSIIDFILEQVSTSDHPVK